MILVVLIFCTIVGVLGYPAANMTSETEAQKISYKLVTRSEWNARPPVQVTPLKVPVPYVVIHHSYIPPACFNQDECSYAMRTMQSMHVDERKWWDTGYHFGVGSDGAVYEGRGWDVMGAHALDFNKVSLGICLIGNWNETLPPKPQLQVVSQLIQDGVARGFIKRDYKLVGHRQVRPTECPGNKLFELIKTWTHYDPTLNLVKNFVESNIVQT